MITWSASLQRHLQDIDVLSDSDHLRQRSEGRWPWRTARSRALADLGLALDQAHRFRREVRAWWAAGWDLLVTAQHWHGA